MHANLLAIFAVFTSLPICAPSPIKSRLLSNNKPTLYIAGDSTAAQDDGDPALLGWGAKIGQYLDIPVVNNAVAGATTRTFTEQGYCEYLFHSTGVPFS
jgi:hypothetical protein